VKIGDQLGLDFFIERHDVASPFIMSSRSPYPQPKPRIGPVIGG
jgi:hypothetical protein